MPVTLMGGARQTIDLTRNTKVSVTFAYEYTVTFEQTGLTSGNWSVSIKGQTETGEWYQLLVFNLINGTYGYKVGPVTGHKSLGVPSKAIVNGAAASVMVTFTKKS